MALKFRDGLTVQQCIDLTPTVCVKGLGLPANRCRYVRSSARRRLQDDLVTNAEYEADLLSDQEVDAVENQTEQDFLDAINESDDFAAFNAEAIDVDGELTDPIN